MTSTKATQTDTGPELPPGMAMFMAANPVFAQAWMDMMAESARFVAARLQADLKTQTALMSCTSPAEVVEVQTAFLSEAMQTYAEEAARLMQMTVTASTDIAQDLKSGHSRGYDDVPV